MREGTNSYEGGVDDATAEAVMQQARAVAERVYRRHLPPYLRVSWTSGKGKWYEDWLKEQLQMLVIDEVCEDPSRLEELKRLQEEVSLVFGLFATSFRILDHLGMHLRAQTLGQYEVWPEDEELLGYLCQKLLKSGRARPSIGPEWPIVVNE